MASKARLGVCFAITSLAKEIVVAIPAPHGGIGQTNTAERIIIVIIINVVVAVADTSRLAKITRWYR